MHHLCYLCLVFVMLCLFITALWSPAGKGLSSWLLFVVCHFPMWYLGSGVGNHIPEFKIYITTKET